MAATRITVMNNGSLRIDGDFEIVDAEGRTYGLAGRTRVSLCRCGQSSTKPFCDGTHKTCGFDAVAVAFDLAPPAPKPEPSNAIPPSGGPPASTPADSAPSSSTPPIPPA